MSQEDIKPLIEDYLERGEDDFEEFEDPDDLYAQFIDQLDGLETQMPASAALQVHSRQTLTFMTLHICDTVSSC